MGNAGSSASSAEYIQAAASLRTSSVPSAGARGEGAFWLRLFPEHPIAALDLFSIIAPEHVREIRATNPRNLALVIVKVRRVVIAWCNRRVVVARRPWRETMECVEHVAGPRRCLTRIFQRQRTRLPLSSLRARAGGQHHGRHYRSAYVEGLPASAQRGACVLPLLDARAAALGMHAI